MKINTIKVSFSLEDEIHAALWPDLADIKFTKLFQYQKKLWKKILSLLCCWSSWLTSHYLICASIIQTTFLLHALISIIQPGYGTIYVQRWHLALTVDIFRAKFLKYLALLIKNLWGQVIVISNLRSETKVSCFDSDC